MPRNMWFSTIPPSPIPVSRGLTARMEQRNEDGDEYMANDDDDDYAAAIQL